MCRIWCESQREYQTTHVPQIEEFKVSVIVALASHCHSTPFLQFGLARWVYLSEAE